MDFYTHCTSAKIFDYVYSNSIRAASWKNQEFANAKTKAPISFAVTAKLFNAFVFD